MDVDSGRHAPLAMDAATFRKLGHRLVDQLAGFLESLPFGPVTRDESPSVVREALGLTGPLPEMGTDPGPLLEETAQLLFAHSLFNGHPRFFRYITAPPAPIGILGDFLAAAVNPNVGAWTLSPAATEIESQTVRWIAELIGYPVNCGGLLLSGGNMANFVCFLAARTAKAGWDVRKYGVSEGSGRRLRVYCSGETHTWIQKATDLGGLGQANFTVLQGPRPVTLKPILINAKTDTRGFFSAQHGLQQPFGSDSDVIRAISVSVQHKNGNWHTLEMSNAVDNRFWWNNEVVEGIINSPNFFEQPVQIVVFTETIVG